MMQERRAAFDMRSYGRQIIERISGARPEELVEPRVMSFEEAIEGREQYEVCRFFTAALQLVRSKNNFVDCCQLLWFVVLDSSLLPLRTV